MKKFILAVAVVLVIVAMGTSAMAADNQTVAVSALISIETFAINDLDIAILLLYVPKYFIHQIAVSDGQDVCM